MIFGIDVDSQKRIQAAPSIQAKCPLCNSFLIPKCGNIRIWHFAHKSIENCDSFKEHETQWHIDWKNKFEKEQQEIIIEKNGVKHIADIKGKNHILEIQHSTLTMKQIKEREDFYGDMVWLLDMRDRYNTEKMKIKHHTTKLIDKEKRPLIHICFSFLKFPDIIKNIFFKYTDYIKKVKIYDEDMEIKYKLEPKQIGNGYGVTKRKIIIPAKYHFEDIKINKRIESKPLFLDIGCELIRVIKIGSKYDVKNWSKWGENMIGDEIGWGIIEYKDDFIDFIGKNEEG